MCKKCVFTLITFILFVIIPLTLIAQDEDIENLQVGVETGTQLLADIPISHFEDADSWMSGMPIDQGIIFSMRRKGRPLEVPEIDPNDGTSSEYVDIPYTNLGSSLTYSFWFKFLGGIGDSDTVLGFMGGLILFSDVWNYIRWYPDVYSSRTEISDTL